MKDPDVELLNVTETNLDILQLEDTLIFKKNEETVKKLAKMGIQSTATHDELKFRYILIYAPSSDLPNEWATVDEANRLMDFARNLPLPEAWKRWVPTLDRFPKLSKQEIEQLEKETRADQYRLPNW